ncbi:MAG TPA: substrate-binding domain-containing protein [Pseudoneobacillus sp.]|nr:substrate-binding domain-containing protein [Pseudoneobacillus sp.]
MKNIKDVAKHANVSIATVSRVVNNLGGYSLATKEKVLQAIEELDYQPNGLARGLINKRTETIAVLFPEVSSMFSSKILKGVEDTVHQRGSSVIVCNTASNGEKTLKYLKVLQEKRIEGIVFVSEIMTEEYYKVISSMKIPVVLVSTESYQYSIPYVKVNDRHAAFSATDYLIKKGHTKIGMISGNPKDMIAGQPRIEGFLDALRFHNLIDNENNIVCRDNFLFADGYQALPQLLHKAPDITAIFVASDEMACGAISSANQMGINVPRDLSVIGYDNLPLAEMTIPPLTTVSQPLEEMGEKAATMLFKMLETGEPVESRIMPHTIIERKSVK